MADRQLLVVIDGSTELDRWGGMGLDPGALLNPDLPLIPPADGTPVERIVQRCGCGNIGCGSLTVTIRRTGDLIAWTDAREQGRRFDIGPFAFAAPDYEAEVRRAHAERDWERRDERVARLVGDQFRTMRAGRPRSFDWSAAWADGEVVVSFTDHRPNPLAGRSSPSPGGGRSYEHDEIFEQYLGSFAVPETVDDDGAVAGIVTTIVTTDPKQWPRPRRQ